jgi:hypothetical protein
MLTVDTAISRFRRDLTLGWLLRAAFLAAVVASLALPLFAKSFEPSIALAIVAVAWLALNFRGVRGARLAAASPSLISAGRFEEAEQQIDEVLRGFSISKTPKLLSLHHLAVLRHAQRRWQESAALSKALLGQRLGPALEGITRPARLILADSLLELGDAGGAKDALAGLYPQDLSLLEAMNLLSVQLDYQSRVGAWDEMLANVMSKVQLAEIMQAKTAARVQALLALAAKKLGRHDLADWLRRRAELLADVNAIAAERPALWEVWGRNTAQLSA